MLAAYGAGATAAVAFGIGGLNPILTALTCLLLIAGLATLGDITVLGVHRRPSAGLTAPGEPRLSRIAVKLLAFYATLGLLASLYHLILPLSPERFGVFLALLPFGLVVVGLVAPPYFVFVDRRMAAPEDGYWQFGQMLLGHFGGRDWTMLRTYLLGWTIKAFFLPIMAAAFVAVSASLAMRLSSNPLENPVSFFKLGFDLVLFIDLAVAVLGYILTLRLLDTHIRSCNPLWYGWIATLICYYPFWGIVYPSLFGYTDGENWDHWLAGTPVLLVAWGGLILACKVMWVWANVTFGLRFSNLTHRGILTGGPFRFTKHPSYISKNVGWWLIAMPFLSSQGWQAALTNCVALLCVNGIYFVRARIEERHLVQDPLYAEYSAWIERHGILARAARLFSAGRMRSVSPPG